MAKTLLQVIRERQQKKAEQEAVPQLGATESLQQVAQAKSGRVSQRGAVLSSQQEQLAVQGAQEEQKQRRYATNLAFSQLQQQEEQQRFQEIQGKQNVALQQRKQAFTLQEQTSQILDNIIQSGQKLDLAKDKAKVDMIGFNMRLTNSKYVDNLKAEGMKSRLDNDLAFQDALSRSIFQEELSMFENSLEFRRLLKADDREFKTEMTEMDINFAMQIAAAQMQAQASGAMFSGISGVVSGGLQAYSQYSAQQKQQIGGGEEE